MIPRMFLRGISSWWLTSALALCFVAAYLAFSFGRNPYPAWTAYVLHAPAGIVLVLVLIVNLIAASVRIIARRLRPGPVSIDDIRSMDIHEVIPLPDEASRAKAAAWLREKVSPRDIGDGGIRRVTGRFSFLPGTLFRLGFIITLGAVMISVQARTTSDAVLHEGDRRDLAGETLTVSAIRANLPRDFLQVGEESLFLLGGVNAALEVSGKASVITPGFPSRVRGRYYRIVHLGYAQPLTVTGTGTRWEGTADLDVLPPGKTAMVPLPAGGTSLTFVLEPERTITKGLVKGREYDLVTPQYRLVARNGVTRDAVIRPGSRAALGPLEVALGTPSPFVRVQVVVDPALPWIYAGAVLTLAGMLFMISRFFWYERELSAVMQGRTLYIGYRAEFYKRWGMETFLRWRDELDGPNLP